MSTVAPEGVATAAPTLPQFDEFARFDADTKYRTPFDSPSPPPPPFSEVGVKDNESHEERQKGLKAEGYLDSFFAAGATTAGTDAPPKETQRPRNFSVGSSGAAAVLQPDQPKRHHTKHKRTKTAVPTSSSSSSKHHGKSASAPQNFDPFFEAVIPDILSSTEILNRRASEPTLGSRRAAAAAAAAAAKKAEEAAEASAQQPPQLGGSHQLSIDPTDKLSVVAASDVNLSGPFQDVAAGPLTPRRICTLPDCNALAFATGLCATHITSQWEDGETPTTPTTVNRAVHRLWTRTSLSSSSSAGEVHLSWIFWKKAEKYLVELIEYPLISERTVRVNGKTTFRGKPSDHHSSGDEWRLSMILGRSKSSAFEAILGATHHGSRGTPELVAGWTHDSDYDFELWIEGFPFSDAQNNWLSELGAQQAVEAQEREAREEEEERQRRLDAGEPESTIIVSSASQALREQRLYDSLQYIKSHWSRAMTRAKTALGWPKNTVTWRFTLSGTPHTLVLTHSEVSGKRRLILDDADVIVKKPSLLRGLILKRSAAHTLTVDNVPLEVRIQHMDWTGDDAARRLPPGGARSSPQPSFQYQLFINSVPFGRNMRTLPEYAGGVALIEQRIEHEQQQAARRAKREAELKRDPRAVLSPDPEEQATSK